MSALSLEIQVKEEKKEKKVKVNIYFYALLSENDDEFLNLFFKLIKYSGTNGQVTNNIFLFKTSLGRMLFINM